MDIINLNLAFNLLGIYEIFRLIGLPAVFYPLRGLKRVLFVCSVASPYRTTAVMCGYLRRLPSASTGLALLLWLLSLTRPFCQNCCSLDVHQQSCNSQSHLDHISLTFRHLVGKTAEPLDHICIFFNGFRCCHMQDMYKQYKIKEE